MHIASAVERRMGRRPILSVDGDGGVIIPQSYLAYMGLGRGGRVRLTAMGCAVAIEPADPWEPAE
ncbi:MAG: hypothetical protein NUV93_00435 [Firmicutes bacterium]|nr:hypothetical protein [Bacillota bacterium]